MMGGHLILIYNFFLGESACGSPTSIARSLKKRSGRMIETALAVRFSGCANFCYSSALSSNSLSLSLSLRHYLLQKMSETLCSSCFWANSTNEKGETSFLISLLAFFQKKWSLRLHSFYMYRFPRIFHRCQAN